MKKRAALVLVAVCVLAVGVPDAAVAHRPPAGHLVYGRVVTNQGTLRIDARHRLPTAPGKAWFSRPGQREVTITLDCMSVAFSDDVHVTYALIPVHPHYDHVVYAAGRGSDGKRYRMILRTSSNVVLAPAITTRSSKWAERWQRGPCGTTWPMRDPEWRGGAIVVLT